MTEEDAIAVAQRIAEEHGWPWLEPARAELRDVVSMRSLFSKPTRRRIWGITSNVFAKGSNVRVSIDDETKAVIEQAFLPR